MNGVQRYKAGMTPERILQLAARPDGFNVHRYRYRDRNIATKAFRLVRDGKLQRVGRDSEYVYYKITQAGREALAANPEPNHVAI